jgi:hypothetical protein
MDILKMLIF